MSSTTGAAATSFSSKVKAKSTKTAAASTTTPKVKRTRRKSTAATAPLTLDAALGSTRAGTGIGTALTHVTKKRKISSHGSAGAAASSTAGGTWEVSHGVFLLGQQFAVPNPPPAQLTVAQLERLEANASNNEETNATSDSTATDDAAAAAAAASSTAGVSTIATAASPSPSSSPSTFSQSVPPPSTAASSIASQLYSWRHYIHELDEVMQQMNVRRQWAMVKYRLLQEKLESEGIGNDAAANDSIMKSTDITADITNIEAPSNTPLPTPSSTSRWDVSSSAHTVLPHVPLLSHMVGIHNRRESMSAPIKATAANVAPINIWAKSNSTPIKPVLPPPVESKSNAPITSSSAPISSGSSIADLPLASAFARQLLHGVTAPSTAAASSTPSVPAAATAASASYPPFSSASIPSSFTLLPPVPTPVAAPSIIPTSTICMPVLVPLISLPTTPPHTSLPLPLPCDLSQSDEPEEMDLTENQTMTNSCITKCEEMNDKKSLLVTPVTKRSDIDMTSNANVPTSVCIPETPSTHERIGSLLITASGRLLDERKSLDSTPLLPPTFTPVAASTPIYTAASLLENDGASIPIDDLDSSFMSQPGLDYDAVKADEHSTQTFTSAISPLPPLPLIAASKAVTRTSSVPTSPGFMTARTFIELLSDEENDEEKKCDNLRDVTAPTTAAAASPFAHVTTKRSRVVSHSAPIDGASDDDDEIEDVTHTKVSSAISTASRSSSLLNQTPKETPRSIFGTVMAVSAPLQWQPSSARKLWNDKTAAASPSISNPATSSPHSILGLPPIAPTSTSHPNQASDNESAEVMQPKQKKQRSEKPAASEAASPIPLAAASSSSPPLPPPSAPCPFVVVSNSVTLLSSFGACCMPSFTSYSLDDLKQLMNAFGLKSKSKNQMAVKLQELWTHMQKKHQANGVNVVASTVVASPAASAASDKPKERKPRAKKATTVSVPTPSVDFNPPDTPSVLLVDITHHRNIGLAPVSASDVKPKSRKADPESKSSETSLDSVSPVPPASSSSLSSSLLPPPPLPPPLPPPAPASIGGVSCEQAAQIRDFIRSQPDLYVQILMFQPIDVLQLAFVLHDRAGIKVHPKLLRSFFDAEGVNTISPTERHTVDENGEITSKKKRGGAHKPRKKKR